MTLSPLIRTNVHLRQDDLAWLDAQLGDSRLRAKIIRLAVHREAMRLARAKQEGKLASELEVVERIEE